MRSTKQICAWLLTVLVLLTGCSGRAQVKTDLQTDKLKVVTTLFPYYDFTRQIAGDLVDLEIVVPAGMDSHSFEPTPADMKTIQEADILICNGGAMEQWVAQVLDAIDTSHMKVLTMMDYVDVVEEEIVEGMEDEAHDHDHEHSHAGSQEHDESHGHEADEEVHAHETAHEEAHEMAHAHEADHDHENDDGYAVEIEYDEHVWTSPVNAMKFTEVIGDALAEADPAHSQAYEEGKTSYLKKLQDLHEEFLEIVAQKKRNMIIVGDKFPFRYLADEYGFYYRAAFSGCSTDTEPSAKTIAYLIDKVRGEQIPVVYYLELSSHRVSEIIGEETGAEPMLLHSCHNVTRSEFDAGVTYLDLMEQNVMTLRKGLVE